MTPDAKRMARWRRRVRLDLVPVSIGDNPPIDVPREDAEEAYERLLKAAQDVERD